MNSGYHGSRLTPDPRRDVLWSALWRFYFRYLIAADATVLDLGSGYGNFINHVTARRRIAVDAWADFPDYIAPGVEPHVQSVTELGFLEDASVDFAFASNLFEHLTQQDFARVLSQLRAKLKPGGTLNILQPNYRYAYKEYFDDYTHVSVYSHGSLRDFLVAHDYHVFKVHPRFLPLTVKSRLPVNPRLIQAYLAFPLKFGGKQMFLRAYPRAV